METEVVEAACIANTLDAEISTLLRGLKEDINIIDQYATTGNHV